MKQNIWNIADLTGGKLERFDFSGTLLGAGRGEGLLRSQARSTL